MGNDGTLTTRRVAVKPHICDVHGGWIKSGSVYLRHTAPPRVNEGQPWGTATKECSTCATMFGRAGLLEKKENEK